MTANPDSRPARFLEKARAKAQAETEAELDRLAARPDCRPEFFYFLSLFREDSSFSTIERRTGRPVAALICLQAPLELFPAFGLHPFKVSSGSYAAGQFAAPHLPAQTCPPLRAAAGALSIASLAGEAGPAVWVLPTACDWAVKFPELTSLTKTSLAGTSLAGASLAPTAKQLHWLELPRQKDSPRGRERWFGEILALVDFLKEATGRRLNRQALSASLALFQAARRSFARLIELKRAGRVPWPWFLLIAGSFFLDRIENWTAAVEKALPGFEPARQPPNVSPNVSPNEKIKIYLAGSPIFFPNFKLPRLLEEAGLTVTADDLCSSERLLPACVAASDPSETGLLRALAETYHQGCRCPIFADDGRRLNAVRGARPAIQGLVFHVLKGCHPYDLESLALEESLKAEGLRFLRLETDYAAEDAQNLLTRLEAFRRLLGT